MTETAPGQTVRDPRRYVDKEAAHWYPLRDRIQKEATQALITDELVAEHARDPLGRRPNFHSKALQQVLGYFRAHPSDGRYVACRLRADGRWGVAVTRPGLTPEQLADTDFATLDEARHAAFLHRVAQLRADLDSEDAR
ncbi:MAG: hypothetical protein ABS81_01440 [Pseudonocardia sp. SCN 72-86]|nr:MAG: hypothetical protein ABS81_01440 [Pseudonocardia sp. SCN 72-86]